MKAEYKVPGGKLLACDVEYDNVITNIKIYGDFFMHPEPAILDLEKTILGKKREELPPTLTKFFEDPEITIFGASPLDFVKVIELALDSE